MKNKNNITVFVIALVAAIVSFFFPIAFKGIEKALLLIFRAIIIAAATILAGMFINKRTEKYNTFKVLLVTLFIAMVFSFIIPSSQLGYSGIEKGAIKPITFIDSISNSLTSFSVFILPFMYILSIGIFYAVLNKTGKYDDIINNTAAKFKNKKVFIIISVLTFGILTAVTGEMYALLFMVPAFIAIAKKLGYDSKAAILSTVGAILIGSAGSLYTNTANQILATKVETNIIPKIIILVILLLALILFVTLGSEPKNTKLEKKKIKKGLPITIAFDVILVLLIIGMVPWNAYFGFEEFNNLHEAVVNFQVFKVSLYTTVLGTTLVAFGAWTIYSLTVLLLVVSVIISIIYKIKFDGLLESISQGIKKSLPYAMILIVANVILVGVFNSGFFITVIDSIGKMKDSVLSSITLSGLSAVVYPDYTYAGQFTLSTLAIVISKKAVYSVIVLVFQAIYSLVLLISPTSILMLMALRYEEVSYKDWFKYIYKFFLGLLIVVFIVFMIVGGKFVKPISYVVLAVLVVVLALLFVLCSGKKTETKKKKK